LKLITLRPFFNFAGTEYEPIGYFCWVGLDPVGEEGTSITLNVILLVLFDTGPILAAFGLILYYQIQQGKRIRDFPPGLLEDYNISTTSSIKYPIAFLLSFLFQIIDNWALYIFGVRNPYLAVAHIAISNCFGFINAIMYGGLKDVFRGRTLLSAKKSMDGDCNFSTGENLSSSLNFSLSDERKITPFGTKSRSRANSGLNKTVIEMIRAQDVVVLDADN
jgi:hypothetical protein